MAIMMPPGMQQGVQALPAGMPRPPMPGPMMPGQLEQMALQNPEMAAQIMAAQGVPPPAGPEALAPQQGMDPNMLGLALQGVQGTQAQMPQQTPPVAPQQGSIAPGGLEALLAMALGGQQQRAPAPSLGQLIAGG